MEFLRPTGARRIPAMGENINPPISKALEDDKNKYNNLHDYERYTQLAD
jgi:hypothetical protein